MKRLFLALLVMSISQVLNSPQPVSTLTKGEVIYYKILKNKPTIDKTYARKLATVIAVKTSKYNINASKYTAILAQESGYRLNAVNHKSKDYGLSQINIKTAKAFNFDINRLLVDMEYSVEAGLIVLADFKKRYGHREDDYWSRYNSSNKQKRTMYKKLVVGYM